MSKFAALFFVMLLCVSSQPVNAQPTDAERIKQLEEENEQLRRELAQLRLELSTLKKQLVEQPKPADPPKDADKPVPAEPGEPGEDQAKVKTYRSADDICRIIPQELGPGRNGWDVFKRKAVRDWLNESIPGSLYEVRRKIKSTEVAFDTNKSTWRLTIVFEPEEMRYMNWEMKETLTNVHLYGEEKEIEQMNKGLRTGSRVLVTGTIDRFIFDLGGKESGEDWRPTLCTITLQQVKVR